MIKVNCACGSQLRSTDNESLYHPTKEQVANGMPPIDGQLYVSLICDNCGHGYTQEFDLVLRQPKVPCQTVSCPKCGEDTEKPMPLLVPPDTYGEVNCVCGHRYYYPLKNRGSLKDEAIKDVGHGSGI